MREKLGAMDSRPICDVPREEMLPAQRPSVYPEWKHCGEHGVWFAFACSVCDGRVDLQEGRGRTARSARPKRPLRREGKTGLQPPPRHRG